MKNLRDFPAFLDCVTDLIHTLSDEMATVLNSRKSCILAMDNHRTQAESDSLLLASAINDIINGFYWHTEQTAQLHEITHCVTEKRDHRHRLEQIPVKLVDEGFAKKTTRVLKSMSDGFSFQSHHSKSRSTIALMRQSFDRQFSFDINLPHMIGAYTSISVTLHSRGVTFSFDMSRLCGDQLIMFRKMDEVEMREVLIMFSVLISTGIRFVPSTN